MLKDTIFNHLELIIMKNQKKEKLTVISEIVLRRMLYVATGLVTAVFAILAIVLLPHYIMDKSLVSAIPFISIIVIVHLLIVVALIWIIRTNKRSGQIKKDLLVATGVILILLNIFIIDGAVEYTEPGAYSIGISMFICVGCNFIAGSLALIAQYNYRPLPLSK